MREGWTYRKLGEICESDLGKTLNQSKDMGDLCPYLCAINIQWDHVDLVTLKTARFSDIDKQKYSVKKGDLLVCEGGDIGRAAIWDKDGTMQYQNALHRIRFIDHTYCPRFYLAYLRYLKNKGVLDSRYGKGVTIQHLVKSSLLSIPVPVPPLPEQERIVAELDLLTGIIDKQKQQIKELDTLAQSIFYDMFGDPIRNEKGWQVKTFGEVGTLQRGSGLSKKDLTERGFPCILYGQIHTRFGEFADSHIACIPTELVHTAKIAHHNDVIMAITSEDIEGSCKSTAWMGDYDIAIGSDAAIYHHAQNGIYVSFYTKTKAFYDEKAKYARGFKVTHISTKEIAQIPLPIPPISLQDSFAEKIKTIESQKASINRSIAEAQKLFDYTMDKYYG